MPNPNLALAPRPGRPKGALNYTTREAREFAARIISDPEYQADILRRARSGQLGAFESALWAYAAGKPPSDVTVRVEASRESSSLRADLASITTEQLAARAQQLVEQIRSLPDAQPVIDAVALPTPDEEREELVRLLVEAAEDADGNRTT
jgi:hypothetical protein